MFCVRAYPLRGEMGGGWALEFESLGPVKWHRADRRVPFGAKKKTRKILGIGLWIELFPMVHHSLQRAASIILDNTQICNFQETIVRDTEQWISNMFSLSTARKSEKLYISANMFEFYLVT